MRTIIAGSRSITDYRRVCAAVEASLWEDKITEVVSGHAEGVDRLGERWAEERGVPVKPFEVTDEDWRTLGKKAGHLRNREMASYALGGALILIWDGISTGSAGMRKEAHLVGLKTYIQCPACWAARLAAERVLRPAPYCRVCRGCGDLDRAERLF